MTRLIKNELNRIYTCKINRISVLLLIMISVIYGFLTVFQDQTITYYEQGIIYGIDAITFEKNLSHGTVGINDDEINKIIDKFQKQTNNINSTDGEAFKTMYSKELRPYEEVISLIDFTLGGTYMDQYKKILEVKTPINFVELWKDKTNCTAKTQSFKSGYSKGYQRFLKKIWIYFYLCL